MYLIGVCPVLHHRSTATIPFGSGFVLWPIQYIQICSSHVRSQYQGLFNSYKRKSDKGYLRDSLEWQFDTLGFWCPHHRAADVSVTGLLMSVWQTLVTVTVMYLMMSQSQTFCYQRSIHVDVSEADRLISVSHVPCWCQCQCHICNDTLQSMTALPHLSVIARLISGTKPISSMRQSLFHFSPTVSQPHSLQFHSLTHLSDTP